jgi:hypothetical protein
MNPRSLKSHVEQAIAQSENEHITNVKIMSTNQLKSGDLSIKTTTNNEMQALRQFTNDWMHRSVAARRYGTRHSEYWYMEYE